MMPLVFHIDSSSGNEVFDDVLGHVRGRTCVGMHRGGLGRSSMSDALTCGRRFLAEGTASANALRQEST